MARRALRIESWLAALPPPVRETYVNAYLSCIHKNAVDAEREELTALVRSASPVSSFRFPIVVERRVRTSLEVPVFDFGVPGVPGSVVTVQLATTHRLASIVGGSAGIGTQLALTRSISFEHEFSGRAGEGKRIFQVVPGVATYYYEVSAAGVGGAVREQRAELTVADAPSDNDIRRDLGLRPLYSGPRYVNVPFNNQKIDMNQHYPEKSFSVASLKLRSHPPQGMSKLKKRLEIERRGTIAAGGSVLGMDVTATLSATIVGTIVVEATLPNGHDYDLRRLEEDREGIKWHVDGVPMPSLWATHPAYES